MSVSKPHLNVVVVGHHASGKSTLIGHTIYKVSRSIWCGGVDKTVIDKYDIQCAELGHPNKKYAWIVDTEKTERARSLTVDTALSKLETQDYFYTVIDTPGHIDFIKNTIHGIVQADIAILVVSAIPSEFEASFAKGGQLRETALLAFAFGIKQLIVMVNKMDVVQYCEERFNEITGKLSEFLTKIGFRDPTAMIPISGLNGDNLVESCSNMLWYKGLTFLEQLDLCSVPVRPVGLPLRIPIQDVHKVGGIGTVAVGRIETGILRAGMTLVCSPSQLAGEVKSIEMHYESLKEAKAGDNVGFNIKSLSTTQLTRGMVCGDINCDPPLPTAVFEAHVIVLDHPNRILAGYTPMFHFHSTQVGCRFNKLLQLIDKSTGQVLQENPKSLKSGSVAICELIPIKPVCVEPFSKYPALGRFVIRDLSKTVAVGVIKLVKRRTEKGDWIIAGGKYDGKIIKPETATPNMTIEQQANASPVNT